MAVDRPWGNFITLDGDDYSGYKVKKITILPDNRLSLQKHQHRSEHWVITKGSVQIRIDADTHILNVNQSIYIPTSAIHRVENIGTTNAELIEIQIGKYLGEDDIERLEDDYGRVN